STSLEALLAIAFHGLRSQRYDRQTPQFWVSTNPFNRLITIHLRHHDVHEHDRNAWFCFNHLECIFAGRRREHAHSPPLQYTAERENIARVVINKQSRAPG